MTQQEKNAVARINRILKPSGEMVKAARSERAKIELGGFYHTNNQNHYLGAVDLESFEKELRAG
jgi:hypothetical protein